MKKILLGISVISLLAANDCYSAIWIKKQGKGPNGYEEVLEYHSASGSSLACKNPGNDECKWETKPSLSSSVQQYDVDVINADVEAQIIGGTLSGSYVLDGEIEVSWLAPIDINDYDLNINIIGE